MSSSECRSLKAGLAPKSLAKGEVANTGLAKAAPANAAPPKSDSASLEHLDPLAPESPALSEGKTSLMAVHALQVLCAAIWGLTFVAGKMAGVQASPLNATLWRFILAGVALAPLVARADPKTGWSLRSLKFKDALGIALSALTGLILYNLLFIEGLTRVDAGRGAVIVCCSPALIYLVSVSLTGTRLSFIRCLGVALSLTGTAWVVTSGNHARLFSLGLGAGDLLMLGCPVAWTAYSLLGGWVLKRVPPVQANALTVAASVAVMALVMPLVIGFSSESLGEPKSYSAATWGALAFLGLGGTAVGFTLYYLGIKRLGAYKAAAYINLVPVFGVLSGWLILSEKPETSLILGLALILLGIRLVQKY